MTKETIVRCDNPDCDRETDAEYANLWFTIEAPPSEPGGGERHFCGRDCVAEFNEASGRYSIFVEDNDEWMHYGWRDTEDEAVREVRSHLEDGQAAFYVPGIHSELEDWDIEVNPAA